MLFRHAEKLAVVLIGLFPIAAFSGTINATVCEVDSTTAGNAANAANPPAGSPCAQFTTTDIDYDQGGQTTIATFLNNPTFFNETNGFQGSDLYSNITIELTGQAYLNAGDNSFVVAHDDGVVLTFDTIGVVVNHPGPTAEDDTPFTVDAPTAGEYNFTLDYAECCGPPAVLKFTVNDAPPVGSSTPEPATVLLTASGAAALLFARKRRTNA